VPDLRAWLYRIEELLTTRRTTVTFDGFASSHEAQRACDALCRAGIDATVSDADTGPMVLVAARFAPRAAELLVPFQSAD
jgi:hypothetical protein